MRCLRRQEGQSLILVVMAMLVVLGISALSIDTAVWYQRHHRAQVAADAASLAAANCLANSGTGKTCTSTTDTADAAQVATTVAAANGVTLPAANVSFNLSAGTVLVNDSINSPPLFAGIAGLGSSVEAARSTANFKTAQPQTITTTTTVNPAGTCGTDCGAIFAGGTCTDSASLSLSSVSGTIDGSVVSDGGLSLSSVSGSITSTDYGSSSDGCSSKNLSESSVSGSVGGPSQLSSFVPFPEDWRSGGNETVPTCTYTAGGTMPSGVTTSGGNITIASRTTAIPPGVYCAPSGTITLNSYDGGASYVTFIAETITFTSDAGGPLNPCTSTQNSSCPSGNILLLYQTGGGTMSLGSISGSLNGTIFAPSATISISSLSGGTGFIEGSSVSASSISGYVGDGPSNIASGQGGGTSTTTTTIPATPASDSLIQ